MDLEISKHCVERWRDRFRPGLDLVAARRELNGVLECAGGEPVDRAPEWSGLKDPDSHTSFLVVGDDLVLVLIELGDRLVAKTCVPRGSITPWERERSGEAVFARPGPRVAWRGVRCPTAGRDRPVFRMT